jgi:hypothetical protein
LRSGENGYIKLIIRIKARKSGAEGSSCGGVNGIALRGPLQADDHHPLADLNGYTHAGLLL